MQSKDYFLPLVIIPVGVAFLLVSAFVFFSNGKSARLIRYKLKIGAFLLSFTWLASISAFAQKPQSTCYMIPPEAKKELTVNYKNKSGGELSGNIDKKSQGVYIYKITNSRNKVVQEDALIFDPNGSQSYSARFSIKLAPKLKKGNYKLIVSHIINNKTEIALETKFKIKK